RRQPLPSTHRRGARDGLADPDPHARGAPRGVDRGDGPHDRPPPGRHQPGLRRVRRTAEADPPGGRRPLRGAAGGAVLDDSDHPRADTSRRSHESFARLSRPRPEAVVHVAEQRAAPYSMKSPTHKRYTIDNNVNATHNVLSAIVESDVDVHLVHLGTMGVYG